MRKRRVGERQPLLYEEEAAFEYDAGNREAAEEILERGVDNDAYTPAQKDELLKRVVAGRAGWVAAFSGSPQEQKVLALRARMEAYRKKQEDMLAEPPQSEEKFVTTPRHATTPVHTSFVPADTTPVNRARDGLTSAPTHSSPNATPVSQTRTGVGFSTVSKAPLIAPGGPQSDDEEDEDDSVKGNQVTQSKLSKPMSPIKEPKEVTHKSPVIKTEPKAKLKVDIGDISHILKWNPKKKDIPTSSKDIRDSLDPSLKAPSACTTSTTSLAKMSPKKGIKGVPVPPTIGTGMVLPPRKITEQAKPTNPVMTNKFSAPDHLPSAVEQGASESKADTALGTRVLVGSDISRALDHYRSPKRQQLDPSVAAANNCADMGSPSSVSSSSSPPVAAMTSTFIDVDLLSCPQVKGKRYIKLEQIGSGGSSKVYRMLGPDLKIYALKKIKLRKLDAQTIAQYTNEIDLLEKLQGNPHIIKLIAAEQDLKQRQINVVRVCMLRSGIYNSISSCITVVLRLDNGTWRN
ncbi:unnamed protein product [Phytophthora lilii]|uniref:Unnamed protein product n=1 Tax=Phytophthora lilii TaxID=2077276 RepID=A0A9W6XD51_9STRA|nr:unnamed protein product [Phytophthora lilii]